MSIRITCPACEASYTVSDGMRGKKVLCRECKEYINVGGGRTRDEDDDDKVMDRKGKPVAAKAARRRDDDDDDDDDEEDAPRSKKKQAGTSPALFIVGGGGLVAVLGVGLFLMMNSDSGSNTVAPPVQPAAPNTPAIPVAAVGKAEKRDAEPPKAKEAEKKDEPETTPVSATSLSGERVYERLLKSTVWILAKQKRAITVRIPAELVAKIPPGGSSDPKQDPNKLTNSRWVGNETLQGYGSLEFQFKDSVAVTMVDKDGQTPGTYVQSGAKVTLGFGGSVLYTGNVTGDTMSGTARNGSNTWTFNVTRQGGGGGAGQGPGAVPMPMRPGKGAQIDRPGLQLTQFRPPRPNMRPPNMRPPIPRPIRPPAMIKPPKVISGPPPKDIVISIQPTATGTGSLVDRKHRLILTNVHVVGDPDSLVIHFPTFDKGGELQVTRDEYKSKAGIKGKVVMREERADIALVQLERLPPNVNPIAFATKSVRPAQQVHSMGNPGASGALWVYSPGKVRQVFNDKWDVFDDLDNKMLKFDAKKVQTDSAINPGDSGGPLVDDRGILVGVAHGGVSSAQNMSAFIDISECRALLKKYYKSIGDTWVPEPLPPSEDDIAKLPATIKKLGNEDFAVRLEAVQKLGYMGQDAQVAFGDIFPMLKDQKAIVRRAVSDALEKIPPHKDDVPMLCQAFQDAQEPMEVRLLAVRAVGRLGTEGKPALPALLQQLKDTNDSLRRTAFETVVAVGPEAKDVSILAETLKTTNIELRRLAAEALIKLGPEAKPALPILLAALKNPDKNLRITSIRALQAIGDQAKEAAPALLDLMKEGGDTKVGLYAALALIKIGDPKAAVPFLIESVKTNAGDLRKKAVLGLGSIGYDAKAAVNELIHALEDDTVRKEAADALVKIGKVAADPIAKKMLAIRDTKARLACIETLGEIKHFSPAISAALTRIAQADPVQANKDAAMRVWKKLSGAE